MWAKKANIIRLYSSILLWLLLFTSRKALGFENQRKENRISSSSSSSSSSRRMGGTNKHCQVCKEAESKYKCPSCLIPYCSLLCYKKHKESPCSIPVSSDSKPVPALLPKNSYQVDESSLILSKAKLEGLVVSDEVCDALKDEKLQKLIYMIDAATNPENELDKAMELEDFRKFTEKILSVVGP